MPMPAATLTIAVGCWTEIKSEMDLLTERPFSSLEANFRFVFGKLLKNKPWREQDNAPPGSGKVSHPCREPHPK